MGKHFSVKNWQTQWMKKLVFPSKKSGSCFWFHLDWPLNGCRIVFSISLSELQSTILSLRSLRRGKNNFQTRRVFTSPDQFTRAFSITFPFHHSSRGEKKKKKKKSSCSSDPSWATSDTRPDAISFRGDADDRHRSVPYPPPDCLSIFLKEHQGLLLLSYSTLFSLLKERRYPSFLSRLEKDSTDTQKEPANFWL